MTLLMSNAECAERTGMYSSQDIVCKDLVNPETGDPQRRRT
jgi:hypothetical protein